MGRKLAVRLYWMLRGNLDYAQLLQGSQAGPPESFCGRSGDRALEWASCLPEASGSLNW